MQRRDQLFFDQGKYGGDGLLLLLALIGRHVAHEQDGSNDNAQNQT